LNSNFSSYGRDVWAVAGPDAKPAVKAVAMARVAIRRDLEVIVFIVFLRLDTVIFLSILLEDA